jgi:hypothetical protein
MDTNSHDFESELLESLGSIPVPESFITENINPYQFYKELCVYIGFTEATANVIANQIIEFEDVSVQEFLENYLAREWRGTGGMTDEQLCAEYERLGINATFARVVSSNCINSALRHLQDIVRESIYDALTLRRLHLGKYFQKSDKQSSESSSKVSDKTTTSTTKTVANNTT